MHTDMQTLAITYQELCADIGFRVAVGNFINAFFYLHVSERQDLLDDPLQLPSHPTEEQHHWAAFCAGAAEYLAERYDLLCPEWALAPTYTLAKPWYTIGGEDEEEATPEPFRKRNVFCGDRIFTNKYSSSKEPGSIQDYMRKRLQILEELSPDERAAYLQKYNARVPAWMQISA